MTEKNVMQSRDLQRRARDILDAILVGEHIHITRYNRPQAIMVPPEWYARASKALADAEQGE